MLICIIPNNKYYIIIIILCLGKPGCIHYVSLNRVLKRTFLFKIKLFPEDLLVQRTSKVDDLLVH